MLLATSEPEACMPCLERRVPGATDLRIFTTELIPAGKHRLDRRRPRLGRDGHTGRPILSSGVSEAGCEVERALAAASVSDLASGAIWTPDVQGDNPEVRSLTRFPGRRCYPYDQDVPLCASDGHEATAR